MWARKRSRCTFHTLHLRVVIRERALVSTQSFAKFKVCASWAETEMHHQLLHGRRHLT